ncbi:MAG: Rrf2 family transcriptional regulator [Chloroflexi bacterium]|nr:Rrf2 family transcriptional regulator [Chloroflexota bacterium]
MFRQAGLAPMLLSTKGDYGVRAIIDLAKHEGEGPVQRAEVARRRQIPESYLDHLLAQLRRAGFIRSVRGPGGGHLLARPAEEICLLHVLEALEGSLAPLACLEGQGPDQEAICGQEWVWQEIYDDMRKKLASVSVADLVEHERVHERERVINYSI